MTIHAQLRWTQGLQLIARTPDGPAVVMDNPEGGSGAGPMELLLMGTAGCTAMDVISILKKKRMAVSEFIVNVSGTRAEDHPRRYTHIDIEFVVVGSGIKPEAVQRAIELSESKYCGAIASLNARITNSYRIETD
jgi:putative redox protein